MCRPFPNGVAATVPAIDVTRLSYHAMHAVSRRGNRVINPILFLLVCLVGSQNAGDAVLGDVGGGASIVLFHCACLGHVGDVDDDAGA